MNSPAATIVNLAEQNGGFYAGSEEHVLPWSFWIEELADPLADVDRLIRIWHGDYLEARTYRADPDDRYVYLFRDGSGFGLLSISENMAFQYFRWFFTLEHARVALERIGTPSQTKRGLPTAAQIDEAHLPEDEFPELFSLIRAIAGSYVSGQDYEEEVRHLALHLSDLAREES